MIWPLFLTMLAARPAYPAVPAGRPISFKPMTGLQIDGWMRWNGFYHSANVYRCRGLSEPAAERQVAEDLGPAFERRRAAMAAALKAKYGSEYHETNEFLAFGNVLTPTYCRRIRYVVSDMRRAAAELARRLKVD